MRGPSGRRDGGEGLPTVAAVGPAPDAEDQAPHGSRPSEAMDGLVALRERLRTTDLRGLSDDDRLQLLHQIELLTRTLAAVSATVQVAFHSSQVGAQIQAGVSPRRAGAAVPDDLAAARMCSPYWGSRDLTAARGLCEHLPRTLQALVTGVITAHQARLVAEGTACVDAEHRVEIDERLAPRLPGISTRELEAAVRALVYEVDPSGFVARARRAASDRGVSVRPAPDVMGILTARLPAPHAIAVYQSLDSAARARRASGDPRTVDQLRADELFERATGRRVVDGVDVEVGLVLTDAALFAGTSDPAELLGHGPVPADYARELRPGPSGVGGPAQGRLPSPSPGAGKRQAPTFCPDGGACADYSCSGVHGVPTPLPPGSGTGGGGPGRATVVDDGSDRGQGPRPGSVPTGLRAGRVWVRRLYTDPVTGVLTRRDPRRRFFTDALRALVVARDRTCRNPWCGAPIRTVDHVRRHRDGGPTEASNGQGLCERCNLARERPRALVPGPHHYRPAPPLLPAPRLLSSSSTADPPPSPTHQHHRKGDGDDGEEGDADHAGDDGDR